MADEKSTEPKKTTHIVEEERPENAATSFGLEDHIATATDPRVNELKHARSVHSRRPSATPKPLTANPSMIRPNQTKPTPLPANAATGYGLEGQKADVNDPRIANMRKSKSQRRDEEQGQSITVFNPPTDVAATSRTAPPAAPAEPPAPVPVPIVVKPVEPPAEQDPPPPPPPPAISATPLTPAPRSVEQMKNDPKEKRMVVSKIMNTDVTFDPSKVYASKTTNTPGNLYSDDEDNAPKPTRPPPPSLFVAPKFDLDDIYAFAVALVRKAGAYALAANSKRVSYTTKDHEKDLNTRIDMEVEAMMVNAIAIKYPAHKTIAEEEVSASETRQVTLTDEPTWIIDPIDGTMNYVHHFPYYCISLAFFVDKQTAFGIVYNPALHEFYTARKGKGAQLNDNTIHTSGQDNLKGAMVLQEYGSGVNESRTSTSMENTKRLISRTHA